MGLFSKIKNKQVLLYLFLTVTYSFIFISIFGYTNFNIHYTDWLMVRHNSTDYVDISINYLNYLAFINDNYSISHINNNAYPFITNAISIDYAPMLMVLLKFIYKVILHTKEIINVQYVWYFGLFSTVLQGIISFIIIKKLTKAKDIVVFLCSIFFVVAPPMLLRFPANFTLAAHFLILLTFLPFIFNWNKLNIAIFYLILGFLACGIHSFFAPILFINALGYCFYKIIKTKDYWGNLLSIIFAYVFGFLIAYTMFGGFGCELNMVSYGYRDFTCNLNSFINPKEIFGLFKSNLFPFLNNINLYDIQSQFEGFSYLGGGFIVLFITSIILLFKKYSKEQIFSYLKQYKVEFFILLSVVLVVFLWAISFNVTFSNHLLLNIKMPIFIETLLNIFRTPGRFIWINFYIVYLFVFIFLLKKLSFKKALIIVFIGLILQIYDINSALITLNKEYQPISQYKNELFDNKVLNDLSIGKNVLITYKITDGMFFENHIEDYMNRKYPRIRPLDEQELSAEEYIKAMKGFEISLNDLYYWAI